MALAIPHESNLTRFGWMLFFCSPLVCQNQFGQSQLQRENRESHYFQGRFNLRVHSRLTMPWLTSPFAWEGRDDFPKMNGHFRLVSHTRWTLPEDAEFLLQLDPPIECLKEVGIGGAGASQMDPEINLFALILIFTCSYHVLISYHVIIIVLLYAIWGYMRFGCEVHLRFLCPEGTRLAGPWAWVFMAFFFGSWTLYSFNCRGTLHPSILCKFP